MLFDLYDDGSPVKAIATIPEIIWELSRGIYPLVLGVKKCPVLDRFQADEAAGLVAA